MKDLPFLDFIINSGSDLLISNGGKNPYPYEKWGRGRPGKQALENRRLRLRWICENVKIKYVKRD